MLITVTPAALNAIWTGLNAAQRSPASPWVAKCRRQAGGILKAAARDGWVGMIKAETVLIASEFGMPTGDLRTTLKLFGVTPQPVYRRPGARVTGLSGSDRIAVADFADVLMQVERLGFDTDPATLCEALRPSLQAKAFLTNAEVSVYWHDRERHRCEPVMIGTGPNLIIGRDVTTLHTVTGYRVDLYQGSDSQPTDLVATAPRWRPRRRRVGLAA